MDYVLPDECRPFAIHVTDNNSIIVNKVKQIYDAIFHRNLPCQGATAPPLPVPIVLPQCQTNSVKAFASDVIMFDILTYLLYVNSKTQDAEACIASSVPSMCPNRLKYLNLLRDIAAFVCNGMEQQGKLKSVYIIR